MIFGELKDFFGYLKENYIASKDAARLKYHGLKDATSRIARNLEETLKYTDTTLDKIYTESRGVKGIFDDVEEGAKNIYSNMQHMGEDIGTMEDILAGKRCDNRGNTDSEKNNYRANRTYSSTSDKNYSSTYRPSRFKSAAIATAAGIGTIKGVYNLLRNKNQESGNNNQEKDHERYSGSDIRNDHPDNNYSDYPYSIEKLGGLINLKNKYFWKGTSQLQDIVEKELDMKDDIGSLLKDAMRLKATDPKYSSLPRLNYDSRIAPTGMYEEMTDLYSSSSKTLKQIASDLERKYGMSVSISTISRNSRKYFKEKGYECTSRKEARKIKI